MHVAHCRWTRRDLIQSRTQTRGSRYRGMEWTRRKLQPPSGGESPPSPRHSWRTPLRSPRTPTQPETHRTAFRWAACLYLRLINNRYKRKALEKCSPMFCPLHKDCSSPIFGPHPPGIVRIQWRQGSRPVQPVKVLMCQALPKLTLLLTQFWLNGARNSR